MAAGSVAPAPVRPTYADLDVADPLQEVLVDVQLDLEVVQVVGPGAVLRSTHDDREAFGRIDRGVERLARGELGVGGARRLMLRQLAGRDLEEADEVVRKEEARGDGVDEHG